MLSQTSRKRLHSALQEPSITTGWKRTRHEVGSRQPAMITETEAFISGNSDLESQSRNKAKDTKAQRPNDLTHPRPYSAQVSGRDDRAPEGYKLAPGIIFTPHPVVASDYGPSSTRRWPSKNSRIRGAPREPVSELSENSSGKDSILVLNSEPSLLNSIIFGLRFHSIGRQRCWRRITDVTVFAYALVSLRLLRTSGLFLIG